MHGHHAIYGHNLWIYAAGADVTESANEDAILITAEAKGDMPIYDSYAWGGIGYACHDMPILITAEAKGAMPIYGTTPTSCRQHTARRAYKGA